MVEHQAGEKTAWKEGRQMRRRNSIPIAMPDERPADREVSTYLEGALISAHDAFAIFRGFDSGDAIALAARRFITRFPPHTTVDQIERALNRRAGSVTTTTRQETPAHA